MEETRIHPETGETLRRDVRRERIAYGPLWREVDLPGWYPEGEGDAVHSGVDLAEADRVFKELKKEYGAHVRKVRKALGLTQEEAGRLIGGGKRAFQKYESGATPPSEAAMGLIEVLARHPEAMETLRAVRGALD
jgi:HTH-type transcriptional regulator/antitoxin MqsA